MKRPIIQLSPLTAILLAFYAQVAVARVARIEISRRLPYAEGRAFDGIGPYQRLLGKVYFALDPTAAANEQVVDLKLAHRNAQGLVEFSADLEMLAPVDLAKARGTLLYDVNNRGRKLALAHFNTGADEFLMRQGYIVVWSGWIAETLPGSERLRMDAPVATEDGKVITSLVRCEMIADKPVDRMTVAQWEGQGCYEPNEAGLSKATLTWREREADAPVPIPREQFKLHVTWVEAEGKRGQLPLVECEVSGGMRPGFIYELIYEAKNPIVQGCGLVGIRDLVSFLKRDTSEQNPLRLDDGTSAAKHTIGFGVSQSGRCLRMMLYDGFNADEQGRQVFDGMIPHVAGGGLGFFNHRFAMPTRHNGQHDNHLYPADVFPFTYGEEEDPVTKRRDGILNRPRAANTVPKIIHTQCSAEYWHRSGSLVHTVPLERTHGGSPKDASIPSEVRIYAIGGAQHSAGSGVPQAATTGQLPHNPTDYRPLMRALLAAMEAWVREGKAPPQSVYPNFSDGTLAQRWAQCDWHPLPGVRFPDVIQHPPVCDYGPLFAKQRIISHHPPARIEGYSSYVVCVPRHGSDNNERGMLMLPSIAVPVATYTGWNLRATHTGAESELLGLAGGYIPFARTREERIARGDPRPALLERYKDFDDYVKRFTAAAEQLVKDRYLLAEDLPRLVEQARKNEGLFADESRSTKR
jgi:hypothetical protein